MKHIMISIKPEYVCKILNREKMLEIRKSVPKEVLNGEECLVEIYCTKDNSYKLLQDNETGQYFKGITSGNDQRHLSNTEYGMNCEYETQCCTRLNGKVVARWHLKEYDEFEVWSDVWLICDEDREKLKTIRENSCLSQAELLGYLGKKYGFAWHIDNLEIYDKPKELSEFRTLPCNKPESACRNCKYLQVTNTPYAYESECFVQNGKTLTRPPQSWCYIE